jgi:hypothetical protein
MTIGDVMEAHFWAIWWLVVFFILVLDDWVKK